jgi:voltage-gated potassium channel
MAQQTLYRERTLLVNHLVDWLEMPTVVLSFVWLVLLIVEFVWGLPPQFKFANAAIWTVFAIDFFLEFFVAPDKKLYLKKNWLIAVSIAVPALRIFRLGRAVRVARALSGLRGARLVTVVASINRTMGAVGKVLGRSGFGYIVVLTILMTFLGAAGMYAFERNAGLNDYGTALWWTFMLFTTIGSEYWPHTPEGRMLCVVLSLYACGVFGYITAILATVFVGKDSKAEHDESQQKIEALRQQIAVLTEEVSKLNQ